MSSIAEAATSSRSAGQAGSLMVNVDDIPWVPFALDGTFFKPLHFDDDQGKATFILKVPAGQVTPAHKHLAAVEAYVIQGGFTYPGEGSVRAGGYTYEPGGCIHAPAPDGDEDLILFVVAQGGVLGMSDDGEPLGVIDNDLMREFAQAGGIPSDKVGGNADW
ncbi:MAG: 2,4'-dihydroxyacetophenone dioxygenase family protein [Pseudomonadota bacterium]